MAPPESVPPGESLTAGRSEGHYRALSRRLQHAAEGSLTGGGKGLRPMAGVAGHHSAARLLVRAGLLGAVGGPFHTGC